MKYSIFDFNQEAVLSFKRDLEVTINGKQVIRTSKIDVTDLLILQVVSDFMNRKSIIKQIIDEKIYFWINYKAILEDLPILDIKKQAFIDRLNKMVDFGLLEKSIVKNEQGSFSFYRIGEKYETLKYKKNNEEDKCETTDGVCSGLQTGCVVDYRPKNSTTKENSTIKETKEEEREYKEIEEPCSHSCQVLDTNNNGDLGLKNSKLDYDAILAEWKNENPNLPSIRLIDAKRQKKILTLLKNNKSNIDEMFKVMRIIGISDFLQGKNDRGWTATFDWLINDTKGCYQKLLAGEYLKTRMEKEDYAGIMRGEIINNKTLYYDREKRKEKYQ